GRIVTPRFGIGRLVLDAHLLSRYRNYLNDKSLLGGDTRLRGYPTQAFLGKDVVSGNLEFRSRPLELLTVQFGAVAFMHVGDAFDGFADMKLKQSVGGGLRVVFPQLDRLVMRIDWGIPVTRGYVEPDSFPGELIWTFRQAFSVPTIPVHTQSL